jgi:hypothetical protein
MQKTTLPLKELKPGMLNLRSLAGIAVSKEGDVHLAYLEGDLATVANKTRQIIHMVGEGLTVIKELHTSTIGNILAKAEGELHDNAHQVIAIIREDMKSAKMEDFMAPGLTMNLGDGYYLSSKSGNFKLLPGVMDAKISSSYLVFVAWKRKHDIRVATLTDVIATSGWQMTSKIIKTFDYEISGLGFRHASYKGIPVSLKDFHQTYLINAKEGTCEALDHIKTNAGQTFRGLVNPGALLELFESAGQLIFSTPSAALAAKAG